MRDLIYDIVSCWSGDMGKINVCDQIV